MDDDLIDPKPSQAIYVRRLTNNLLAKHRLKL